MQGSAGLHHTTLSWTHARCLLQKDGVFDTADGPSQLQSHFLQCLLAPRLVG